MNPSAKIEPGLAELKRAVAATADKGRQIQELRQRLAETERRYGSLVLEGNEEACLEVATRRAQFELIDRAGSGAEGRARTVAAGLVEQAHELNRQMRERYDANLQTAKGISRERIKDFFGAHRDAAIDLTELVQGESRRGWTLPSASVSAERDESGELQLSAPATPETVLQIIEALTAALEVELSRARELQAIAKKG